MPDIKKFYISILNTGNSVAVDDYAVSPTACARRCLKQGGVSGEAFFEFAAEVAMAARQLRRDLLPAPEQLELFDDDAVM